MEEDIDGGRCGGGALEVDMWVGLVHGRSAAARVCCCCGAVAGRIQSEVYLQGYIYSQDRVVISPYIYRGPAHLPRSLFWNMSESSFSDQK